MIVILNNDCAHYKTYLNGLDNYRDAEHILLKHDSVCYTVVKSRRLPPGTYINLIKNPIHDYLKKHKDIFGPSQLVPDFKIAARFKETDYPFYAVYDVLNKEMFLGNLLFEKIDFDEIFLNLEYKEMIYHIHDLNYIKEYNNL